MTSFKATLSFPDRPKHVLLLQRADDYKALLEKVQPICSGNFRMKYKDEDGDLVTIGSSDELMYAFTESPDGLEIIVEKDIIEGHPFQDQIQAFDQIDSTENVEESQTEDIIEKSAEIYTDSAKNTNDIDFNHVSDGKDSTVLADTDVDVVSISEPPAVPSSFAEDVEIDQVNIYPAPRNIGFSNEQADIIALGKQFMSEPAFSKILASNMHKIMAFVATGNFEECYDFLVKEISSVMALSKHPFFLAIKEPSRFSVIKKALSNQLRSASSAMILITQALFSGDLKVATPEATVQRSVQTEAPALKSVSEVIVQRSVQTESPALNSVQTVPPTRYDENQSENQSEDDNKGRDEKFPLVPDLKRLEDLKASAKKEGFTYNVGGGNFIKWQFIEGGIPSIKYFKHGWKHSTVECEMVKEGYRLVRINDSWLWNLTKSEVQNIWLKENGGAGDSILFFMSLDQIHPCEKNHDSLKLIDQMGFHDTKKKIASC